MTLSEVKKLYISTFKSLYYLHFAHRYLRKAHRHLKKDVELSKAFMNVAKIYESKSK